MGFWIFSFCISLVIPFTMIGFGWWLYRHCPPRNAGLGYRTNMSMKNNDTWKFANQYSGRLWFFWGRILLLPSVIPLLFLIGKDEEPIGICLIVVIVVQMVFLIGSIFPTERALKRTFDQYGFRKK